MAKPLLADSTTVVLSADRPRRFRWLRFSLRTLLLLMALLAALVAVPVNRATNQRKAVERVLAAGGQVVYDFEEIGDDEPRAPKWLRRLLGNEYFQTVHGVYYRDCAVADADLEPLVKLHRLQTLFITGCPQLTNQALVHVNQLADLETLILESSRITDADLPLLQGLHRLKYLSLRAAEITDGGLECLIGMPALEALLLADTRHISDAGLIHVGRMVKLTRLDLGDESRTRAAPITDEGLRRLDGLKNLTMLALDNSSITEASLQQIQAYENLVGLDLGGCAITDEGLSQLTGLSKLRFIALSDTQVSDEGLVHLQKFPKLGFLVLGGDKVSDAGLKHVTSLKAVECADLGAHAHYGCGPGAVGNHDQPAETQAQPHRDGRRRPAAARQTAAAACPLARRHSNH